MPPTPSVVPLEGSVRAYAWGSRTLLAGLRGDAAATGPEAEVWFGAHPSAPSLAHLPDGPVPLDRAGLPAPGFLLKLLAAAAPLSVQVHPDRTDAAAGFAAEEAAGVPRDAAHRTYPDPYDKPELLRALTPMRLLVGARPADEAAAVLDVLLAGDDAREVLAAGGLRGAAALLLTAPARVTEARLAQLRAAVAVPPPSDPVLAAAVALARELLAHHPSDPGVIVALLLAEVRLAPGEAVFVPAGVPHAYLEGLGVEVMRSSDNVVRGGLTAKHVDVDALVRLLDPAPVEARVEVALESGWRRHLAPTDAFVLHEADVDGTLALPAAAGPRVLLCAGGSLEVAAAGDATVRLGPTGAAYVHPDAAGATVRGRGLAFLAA